MPLSKPIRNVVKKVTSYFRKPAIRPMQQTRLNTDKVAKVLVIGETGSGKSTFINYLTNYFLGGDLENIRVAIPSQYHPEPTEEFEWNERSIADNTQSQTDDCHQYIFVDRGTNKQYLFLDSPGLGDTRGFEQDAINMDKIIDAVENLGDLTVVIIVVNGSVCREHLLLRNIVARLQGHLPNAVMKQVIVVLTNAKRHEATFDVKLLHLHGTVYPYYMQNAAFCSDPNEWDESTIEALQLDWNQSMEEIEAIIEKIDSFKATSVGEFTKVKEIRSHIKTLLHTTRLQIVEIQRMQDEIAMYEEGLKHANTNIVAFNNYSTHRTVEKIEIVDAPHHSTLCQNCNHVCHDHCNLDETTIVGAQIFKQCKAMDPSGNCEECRHHCSYTTHYHAKSKVQVTQQTLEDVIADIKAKYDKATNDKNENESQIKTKLDAKALLEKALEQKNQEIRQYCLKLKRICSGFNLTNELSAFLDQLRVEASLLRDMTAREKANEFIRSLQLFCDQIESDQELTKTCLPEMVMMDTRRTRRVESYVEPKEPRYVSDSPPTKPDHIDPSVIDLLIQLNTPSNANPPDTVTDQISPAVNEKTQQSTVSKTSSLTAENINRLTTKELVSHFENEKTDKDTSKLIFAELTRRSQGKSTGPVFDASDIMTLNEHHQKYRESNTAELIVVLHKLQNQVNDIIDTSIVRLTEVDSIALLEMCAIQSLLSKKSKSDEKVSGIESSDRTFKQPQPLFTSNSNNSPINLATNYEVPPDYELVPIIGGPDGRHIVKYVFVKKTTLPSVGNEFVSDSSSEHNCHRSTTKPNLKTSRTPRKTESKRATQTDQQRVNTHYEHRRSSPPHVTMSDDQSVSDQTDDDDASSVVSSLSISTTATNRSIQLASGTILPPVFSAGNKNRNDLRSCSDTSLVKDYHMLGASRNRTRQHAIYDELERRCYGDHPLLIVQRKDLFDQVLGIYCSKSKEELTKLQQRVRETIDLFLGNKGAPKIHTLPPEYIIEAAVLAKLLAEKP